MDISVPELVLKIEISNPLKISNFIWDLINRDNQLQFNLNDSPYFSVFQDKVIEDLLKMILEKHENIQFIKIFKVIDLSNLGCLRFIIGKATITAKQSNVFIAKANNTTASFSATELAKNSNQCLKILDEAITSSICHF